MTFSAFRQHVDCHEDHIYRYARSILNDGTTAKDVTQDVLVTLWEHRDDVDDNRLRPWLMRVTRNACIDQLRHRQTRQKTMTVDTDGVEAARSASRLPDRSAVLSDFEDHLHAALEGVDEPYRRVVELRELQELKYREISDILDMPLNTVKVYIHRGRKKLHRQLSDRLGAVPA